jgi:hypothetical protein
MSDKLCETNDVSRLLKGGEASCAICCARSDDESELCKPVAKFEDNLFCGGTGHGFSQI